MAQFGVGPELAAQCPSIAPLIGWRPWSPDVDGPIPDALAARAQVAASNASADLGAVESYPLPGVTALIRVEPHVWGRDAQSGALVQGCFRAGGIYLPDGSATSESINAPTSSVAGIAGMDKLSKTIAVLTALSLAVGTAATLASWRSR